MTQALSPPAKYVSHLPALFGLLALVARIHRRHLPGDALFLGNFDRLNRFLNTVQNPERVTPRVFVPEHRDRVRSMKAGRKKFFPSNDPGAGPGVRSSETTLLETPEPLPEVEQTSGATAVFAGNKNTIRVTPAKLRPRASPSSRRIILQTPRSIFSPSFGNGASRKIASLGSDRIFLGGEFNHFPWTDAEGLIILPPIPITWD